MKSKYEKIFLVIILLKFLCFESVTASILRSISVTNNVNQSIIIIRSNLIPTYKIFSIHTPERMVIDLLKISKINNDLFPIEFDSNNLIKRIRTSSPVNSQSIRIVCDLNCEFNIQKIMQKKIGKDYCILLTISKKIITESTFNHFNSYSTYMMHSNIDAIYNQSKPYLHDQISKKKIGINHNNTQFNNTYKKDPIVVAIDAGHGGHDPGATGRHGIYEKNITFGIAKKLKSLLDMNPTFKAVMIRDGDYFLSITDRSDLARKKKANILISIHADSALNPKVKGASIWILSNRRAQTEMINWLQRREKHSELLGGLGDILTNYQHDPYFNRVVLDLQFCHAQREGHNIATQMLHKLKNVSVLHKSAPEYSNFGILRSPDIASVLVETGFISNAQEAYLLATHGYQKKIAQALYQGLLSYFTIHQEKKV